MRVPLQGTAWGDAAADLLPGAQEVAGVFGGLWVRGVSQFELVMQEDPAPTELVPWEHAG